MTTTGNQHSVEEGQNLDRHFRTDHLDANLGVRSVRSGAASLLGQVVKSGLLLAATACLARLLEPSDFGLVAMVAALTAFLAQFRDLGLAMSTVQRPEITGAQVEGLFWINAGFGILLAALTALAAPGIAWFYNEPRLTPIARALAMGVLLAGLGVQHQALLRRQMRFGTLAGVEACATGLAVFAAILSAYLGAGYWSLVILELVLALAMMIGLWSVCDWRPGPPRRAVGLRSLLAFGGHLSGFNLVNYLIRNLDNVLVGWRWGARALGHYAKAYDLLMFPLNLVNAPLAGVAVSGLSRLQHDPSRFRGYYLRALTIAASMSMPLSALLLLTAEPLIAILLGPSWSDAADILRLLAISAAVQPVVNTAGWLYVASGKTARMFRWGLFAAAITIAAFGLGLPYGPKGVALAYAGTVVLLAVPCMALAVAGSSVTLLDVWRACWHPLAAATLSAGIAYGVMIFGASSMGRSGAAVLGGVVMGMVYLGVLLGTASSRKLYLGAWRALRVRCETDTVGGVAT